MTDTMLATDRPCPNNSHPIMRCPRTLSEWESQGEHKGEWVEGCYHCGYLAVIPRPETKDAEIERLRARLSELEA